MIQTKQDTLVLQVGGGANNPTPLKKKCYETLKTKKKEAAMAYFGL
jgi:hypothetical protein